MIKLKNETCQRCGQGELIVMRNLIDDTLYLHCGECETGWKNLNDRFYPEKGFLTLTEDFDAVFATFADIDSIGWGLGQKIDFEEF